MPTIFFSRSTFIAALSAAAILGACATGRMSTEERFAKFADDPRLGEQVDKICFSGSIDGFRDNTRDSVILTRGVRDDYLVFVDGCPAMSRALSLRTESIGSCLRKRDWIITSDNGFGMTGNDQIGTNQCQIESIYKWNKKAGEASEMSTDSAMQMDDI